MTWSTPAETLSRLGVSIRVCTGFYGHGAYTPRRGYVRRAAAAQSPEAWLGIDLGATHVRFAVGTRTGTFLEAVYLTGHPDQFVVQVEEIGSVARSLGASDLRTVAVAVAGQVELRGAEYYVSLTNHETWRKVGFSELVRATGTWKIGAIENDMLMLHPHPTSQPGIELLAYPTGSPAINNSPKGRESLRSLTVHVGTGLNIGITAEGASIGVEYGHEPYPPILARDGALLPTLSTIYNRIVTWEDLLGGRALGPLLLAYCSGSSALAGISLQPAVRAALHDSERLGEDDPFSDGPEVLHLIQDVIKYTTFAAAAYGPPKPDTTWQRLARYGGWRIAEMSHQDGTQIARFISDWALRFGFYVLTACQTTMADEVIIACPRLGSDAFRVQLIDALFQASRRSRLGSDTLERLTVYTWRDPNGALAMLEKARGNMKR